MARSLPRRALLGVVLGPADGGEGLPVADVVPASMAAAAGVRPGDRILSANGRPLRADTALAGHLRELGGQREATLVFEREGQRIEERVEVAILPKESIPGCRVSYGQVEVAGALLRTIATEPETEGPHPAVLLVQGIGCASVDFYWTPEPPLCRLIHGLAAAGFATLRVDKPGVGDSEGGPCEELGFSEELAAFEAALHHLASGSPSVDPSRLAIVGHSVGGMMAPLLARGTGVAAMVVIGTSARKWSRCILGSIARQHALRGMPAKELGRRLDLATRMHRLVIEEGRTPAEAASDDPELAELLRLEPATYGEEHLFGRAPRFFRELSAIDLEAAFREAARPTLVIHGEHDWVVGPAEAEEIAAMVRAGGAPATLLSAAGLDHQLTLHRSREESLRRYGQGPFDPGVIAAIGTFLGHALSSLGTPDPAR